MAHLISVFVSKIDDPIILLICGHQKVPPNI